MLFRSYVAVVHTMISFAIISFLDTVADHQRMVIDQVRRLITNEVDAGAAAQRIVHDKVYFSWFFPPGPGFITRVFIFALF